MSRFYEILREAGRFEPPGERHNAESREEPANGSGNIGDARAIPPSIPDCTPLEERTEEETNHVRREASSNGTAAVIHTSFDLRARVIPHAADSVIVEHYRRLRTRLLQEQELRPFRLLMVTSPNPQEGKTVTAVNLALSFSMLPDCKVLIIDGDLRKGSLGKWLGVDGHPGLSNLVEGTATIDEVLLKCNGQPIHVLLRGTSKVSPAELLNSPNLQRRLRQIAEQFDLVLVDSPPLNLVTDAQLLAQSCDAVLIVARAFSTTSKSFCKAAHDLQSFRVVGAVLNGAGNGRTYLQHKYYD